MEKLSINLKDLSPIITSLVEKIQLLDSGILTKQQKLACTKEMLEVVNDLRAFFARATSSKKDEDIKSFVEKIERALSQFEWDTNVVMPPFEFNKFSENGKELLSSVLKLLGMKKCGSLIIETYLKLCLKVITEMNGKVDNDKNMPAQKSDFKLLLDGFSSTVNMLKKYWHIAFSAGQKNTIMLCLHQVCKVLPNLLKMIECQNVDIRKYLLKLLTKCLSKIQDEIHSDGKSHILGQEFLSMMDFCLHKLNELSNCTSDFASFVEKADNTVTVLKPVIDELLCTVMSIGQVTSFKEDYCAILAASQKVLIEFSELDEEIKRKNGSAIRLNASSTGESLCNLEQKVNIAVLKLVLEVFSNVNSPLMRILSKCRMDITKSNKASEDLNILTSDFDSEMDKIMQIGFFAISCTTNLKRIIGIQSCLASLESLETELIPSVTALYVDCNSNNKANFQYLFDFWVEEITELKVLIDSILDPAGFCGVVRNEVKCLNMSFKEDLSSPNLSLNKLRDNLKQAVRYSRKLVRTLKKSMEDDSEINKTTEDYFKKFQLAVQECEAVVDLMEEVEDSNKTISQATKRFDFLMLALDKLSSHLFFLVNHEEIDCGGNGSDAEQNSFPNIQIPQKNYYKLCDSIDVASSSSSIPEFLTPYVTKGILRSKKRSALYTDPRKHSNCEAEFDKTAIYTKYWDKTPTSSRRSRCCRPLTLNLELENTVDLEITAILENISALSNTFSETSGERSKSKLESSAKVLKSTKDVACGKENNTGPTYKSSGCCAKLDNSPTEEGLQEDSDQRNSFNSKLRRSFLQTLEDLSHNESLSVANDTDGPTYVELPDRINDLKIVEEKIKFLKNRMPFGFP